MRRFHSSIESGLIVAFFAASWGILWRHLSSEWSLNEQYSYGWFVPLFAIVLFWLRWEDAPQRGPWSSEQGDRQTDNREQRTENSKVRAGALLITIFALLLLFPLRIFEIGNPDWRPLGWLHALCVVAITLVFLWRIGGAPWLKHFAFPVAFTLVAVPWITPIEEPIVQSLMRLVAAIASEAAALFGIPAQLQGNLIRIPNGLVGVNEACSGVRSLQTSLMIGLLFGELKRLSILRRLALIAGAVAIAFAGNIARAFFLVWVAATQNTAAAARWHDLAGYAIVGLVFVGCLLLAILLGRRQKSQVTNHKSPVRSQFRTSNFEFRVSAAAIVWLLLIEIAAAGWYRAHERNLAQSTRWEVQWPREAPGFHEIKVDEDIRRILRFDQGRAASWKLPLTFSSDNEATPAKFLNCTLYFFRWNSGKNSALLANLHRPDVCLPAIGWNQSGDAGVKKYPVAPELALPFRHFEFRHGSPDQPAQQTADAFYCLWEDRVSQSAVDSQFEQMSGPASAWTRNERICAVLKGRRHLGQQVLELIVQGRGTVDENEINEQFARMVPTLIKVEQ